MTKNALITVLEAVLLASTAGFGSGGGGVKAAGG